MAIKSGLKPILSAVTPIKRENRKLAIHAAEPRMPLTVAIWPLSNDSTTVALSMQEMIWCPKPPMEISTMVIYGSRVTATTAREIIRNAPVTELATTELTREQPNRRVYRRVR